MKNLKINKMVLAAATSLMVILAAPATVLAEGKGQPDIMEITIPATCTESAEVKLEAVTPGAPMPESDTLKINSEKPGVFAITYYEPNTFEYKAYQINTTDSKITYDKTEYEIVVSVFYNDKGEIDGSVIVKNAESKLKASAIHFENKKVPEPTPEPQPKKKDDTHTGTGAPIMEISIMAGSLLMLLTMIIFGKKNKEAE